MKMRRVFLFAFCLVIIIATAKCAESSAEHAAELVDPVEDVGDTEEEDPAPRPIRASAAATATPRKRRRGRKNRLGGNPNGRVQKRRLAAAFRPTRAPLFEASPPDPYMDSGIVGPTSHYGHSHSPPTRDPYYSPSRYEREKKRQRIKLASDAPLVPLPQNSFDDPGPAVLSNTGFQPKPDKNYAFSYAVGNEDEDDDFSHKQTKDGPITVGEYRITLPDGRTQVVRYTAGGKHGYKADVTYEHPDAKALAPAGPTGFPHHTHHKQYHDAVQPTHHLSATPSSSFNSNRVIKSRPLKNVALHSHEDVEYSPGSSHDDDFSAPHPSPKIRLKGGGEIHPSPTPTADYLNGIGTTPTPRPNSIYDKISPFRGGKYSGSEELAYAHEHSPRAGPVRSKSKVKKVTSTAASFYESPSPSPYPHKATILPAVTTKKYKNHGVLPYIAHQTQANHLNEYVRPQKHIQYLQETPVHHHQHQHVHPTPLIAKPLKNHGQHVLPVDHYDSGPYKVSYAPQVHKIRKIKKNKHGIHNSHGQYLLQAPVTAQTPVTSYHQSTTPANLVPKEPFHYYNSYHQQQHHGFGQILPSPTPTSSVTHSESPFPNPYHLNAYPTGPTGLSQPRLRALPDPPSTAGQVYQDSPVHGDRPTRLGVKEVLDRLPGRELSSPKTTIHPYEVGAVDYGKGVAYGNSPQDKGYPDTGYRTFESDINSHTGLDNLDPNSLFNSVTSPGSTGLGFSTANPNIGYYTNDVSEQFNFLDGFHNYDIEQANVREIRQPRPARMSGRLTRRINMNRRPDKRRGVPASSSEPTKEEMEMAKSAPSSSPRPGGRQRQRQQQQQVRTSSPRSVKPSQQPPPSSSTTARARARRRRMRTQQPKSNNNPMMHIVESRRNQQLKPNNQMMHVVESRRPRTRSRSSSSSNN